MMGRRGPGRGPESGPEGGRVALCLNGPQDRDNAFIVSDSNVVTAVTSL